MPPKSANDPSNRSEIFYHIKPGHGLDDNIHVFRENPLKHDI